MNGYQTNDLQRPGGDGPVRYDGWPKGMDNRNSDFDIPHDTMRDAVNVNVMNSGRVSMRPGIRQAISDPDAHSVFSDGSRIVWATKTTLKVCTDPERVGATTVLTNVALIYPLSYVALHGNIYFSNEQINGLVNATGAYEAWGILPPTIAPTLSANKGGNRIVLVTCTYVTATGEESGAPIAKAVMCDDAPIITVSNIPQSLDSRVVGARIYVSEVDGSELFAKSIVQRGTTQVSVGVSAGGELLKTLLGQPPPCGQLLEYLDGVIYIAQGSIIWRTEPLRYGVCVPDHGFFLYPDRVTLLKAVPSGLFVGSNQTFFMPKPGSQSVEKQLVMPYKAIEGAAISIPDVKDVAWLSERGIVRGGDGGQVVSLTESQIAMDRYQRATMGMIEYDGHKALVVISREAGVASPFVAKDWVTAETARLADIE